MSLENHRKSERIEVDLKVNYESMDAPKSQAFIRNISKGGVFIRTDTPLPAGSQLNLEIMLPDSGQPLRVRGEVKWCTKDLWQDATEAPGMGIQFIAADDGTLKALARIVEQMLKKQ